MKGAPKISGLETVYLPAEQPEKVQKILLVLHGLGDSIEGYRFLPQILNFPSLSYLLVNAPDRYYTGFSWYDIFNDQAPGIIRSRGLLSKMLTDLKAQGWKSQDIGLFGFSQGCVMSLDIALRYPEPLGCVVGVSGYVAFLEEYPGALSPVVDQQKILFTHGTLDKMVPSRKAHEQIKILRKQGVKIEWSAYEKEHTIDPAEEIPKIRGFIAQALSLDPEPSSHS
jgi:phospholipase/carboxylesterase